MYDKIIKIETKKDLDIYMNPQRQRLLKCMELLGKPVTPKQLSEKLDISASSVTLHLKKLMTLGLVELDHTEMIHGICARFYKKIPVQVQLYGGKKDALQPEKELLLDYMMTDTWNGFRTYLAHAEDSDNDHKETGDLINGILYLNDHDVQELKQFLQEFQEKHSQPKDGASAWESAHIFYPRENI